MGNLGYNKIKNTDSAIDIIINGNGDFKIDNSGIRTKEPISIDSVSWNGNILTISEHRKTIVENNSCLMIGGVYNGNVEMTTINGKSSIKINGIEYVPDKQTDKRSDKQSDKHEEIFTLDWKDTSYKTPMLQKLDVSGVTKTELDIILHKKCKILASGWASIKINGNHLNTCIKVLASGSSRVEGNGKYKELRLKTSGESFVSGLHIMDKMKVKSSGASHVNINHSSKCIIHRQKSGVSGITLIIRE